MQSGLYLIHHYFKRDFFHARLMMLPVEAVAVTAAPGASTFTIIMPSSGCGPLSPTVRRWRSVHPLRLGRALAHPPDQAGDVDRDSGSGCRPAPTLGRRPLSRRK